MARETGIEVRPVEAPLALGDPPRPHAGGPREAAAYLDAPNGRIYSVEHEPQGERRGAVLICGCLGAERERAYYTLATWARRLAAAGYHAMRFDYRGMGESEGRFEDLTMSDWAQDIGFCATQLRERSGGAPVVLHGVRMGALLATEVFGGGRGDGLLLWAPPASGSEHLQELMRRSIASQMFTTPSEPRRTREEQFSAIEAGQLVNVDGYFWSKALCADANRHASAAPPADEPRPWLTINIRKRPGGAQGHAAAVRADPFWESSKVLVPDTNALFHDSLIWLTDALARRRRV